VKYSLYVIPAIISRHACAAAGQLESTPNGPLSSLM